MVTERAGFCAALPGFVTNTRCGRTCVADPSELADDIACPQGPEHARLDVLIGPAALERAQKRLLAGGEVRRQQNREVLKQLDAVPFFIGIVHAAEHGLLHVFGADQLQIGQHLFGAQQKRLPMFLHLRSLAVRIFSGAVDGDGAEDAAVGQIPSAAELAEFVRLVVERTGAFEGVFILNRAARYEDQRGSQNRQMAQVRPRLPWLDAGLGGR